MTRLAQAVRERLRRLFRPPRTLKITPSGRVYLLMTLGVGLGALNTGNNLLYLLLGLQLSTIVLSGFLSEASLRGLRVRRLGTEAAFAEESFAWRWAIQRERGRSYALVLAEAGAGLVATQALAVLEPGQEVMVRASATAARRGPTRLHGIKVTTTFPFGLFAKSRVFDVPDTLLVFPRRGGTGGGAPPEAGQLGQHSNPRRPGGDGELLALRNLEEGEDARRVHWMKSASAGRLLRAEREREERRSYLLSLGPATPGTALERRCEALAALAHRLLHEGHEVGLETPTRRLRPSAGARQEHRLLQALAWAGFEERP